MEEVGQVGGDFGGEVFGCVLCERFCDEDVGVVDQQIDVVEVGQVFVDDVVGGVGRSDVVGNGDYIWVD